jgi:hypothetical protein
MEQAFAREQRPFDKDILALELLLAWNSQYAISQFYTAKG